MPSKRYKLNLGEGAYGPGDLGEITILDEGTIAGPNLPNWQDEYMLAKCIAPNSYRGQELKYVVVSPRYANASLRDIRRGGVAVSVGRVLPGVWATMPQHFAPDQVEHWAVGMLLLSDEGS